MSISKITADTFDENVLKNTKTAVVDFYADWCGPCKMLAPTLEELSGEVSGADFFKLNVDDAQQLCVHYGVMSIPTVIVFRGGQEVDRLIGLTGKEQLRRLIEG